MEKGASLVMSQNIKGICAGLTLGRTLLSQKLARHPKSQVMCDDRSIKRIFLLLFRFKIGPPIFQKKITAFNRQKHAPSLAAPGGFGQAAFKGHINKKGSWLAAENEIAVPDLRHKNGHHRRPQRAPPLPKPVSDFSSQVGNPAFSHGPSNGQKGPSTPLVRYSARWL